MTPGQRDPRPSGFVWRPVAAWLLFVAAAGLEVLTLEHGRLDVADACLVVGIALGWFGGYLAHGLCNP